jgi:hypothetical protein
MRIPEDVQARIREEEAFRAQVKRELEGQKADGKITPWKFLNSNLGILIVTSIFVTGLGSLFTLWNQKHDSADARRKEERKILDEYDMRLNEIKYYAAGIEQATDDDQRSQLLMYVWYAARGTQEYQPALPEFRGAHMAGLIVQLEGLGSVDVSSKAAIDATEDLNTGVERVNGAERQSPKGFRLFSVEHLHKDIRALQGFRDFAWHRLDKS